MAHLFTSVIIKNFERMLITVNCISLQDFSPIVRFSILVSAYYLDFRAKIKVNLPSFGP